MNEDDRAELTAVTEPLLAAVREFRDWLAGPIAPDAQVRTWRLCGDEEWGGIYCAQPDCGCECEANQILSAGWSVNDDDDDELVNTFTLDDLHALVAEHIARRAEQRVEEAGQ